MVLRFKPWLACALGLQVLAASLVAPRARAEDEVSAEMLFDRALTFKDAERCDEALPLFIASHRLAPSVGSLLNIADCERSQGRSATAWHRFQQAASLAASLGDDKRALYARTEATALEPDLHRVDIDLQEPPAGLSITVDGRLWPEEQWRGNPTEPGAHDVRVEAPGFRPFQRELVVGDAPRTTWRIPALVPFDQPARVAPLPAASATQRYAGWIGLGVGGLSLLTSAGLGIGALIHEDAIDDYCPGGLECLPEAADLQRTALDLERAAIATVTAGASLVGVGLILVATGDDEPSEEAVVVVGPSSLQLRWTF